MTMGAILVVGTDSLRSSTPGFPSQGPVISPDAKTPIACLQVLGKSCLERSLEFLQRRGVAPVAVVLDENLSSLVPGLAARSVQITLVRKPADLWFAGERMLADYAGQGMLQALLIRLGPYVEFELNDLMEFHRAHGGPATRLYEKGDPLDFWLLDLQEHSQNGLADTMAFDREIVAEPYGLHHYVNRMRFARDLRQLVVDALLSRCSIRPEAPETKPGVWVDDGARVHRGARIVAPAYVGKGARIEADVLITRFSNIECDSHADYGTVVESASVLANTYLGPCLDVAHAVVAGTTFVDLRRNVAVEIDDPSLVGRTPSSGTGDSSIRRAIRSSLFLQKPRHGSGSNRPGQPLFASAESNV